MKEITLDFLRPLLRQRPVDGHKGTFGQALIIAGQWGMAGASVLAARACLRSGVGKVCVHIPRRNNDILQTSVPEAVLLHDVSEERFSRAINVDEYDAVAIGPGLGTHKETGTPSGQTMCPTTPYSLPTEVNWSVFAVRASVSRASSL